MYGPVMKVASLTFGLVLLATMLGARGAGAEEPVLHVYNWSDYIGPDTIPKFEHETGIKVTYDVYDSNEILEAKLFAGRSGYDIVVPSASPYMARQIAANVYMPLDKSKLDGWEISTRKFSTSWPPLIPTMRTARLTFGASPASVTTRQK